MPVDVYWAVESPRILRVDFVGPWTLEDLSAILQTVEEYVLHVIYTVDVVVNLQRSAALPARLLSLSREFNAVSHPHYKGRVFIICRDDTSDTLLRMLARMAPRFGRLMMVAASPEHAYEMIARYYKDDPTRGLPGRTFE